jgi:hypothetical protein
MCVCQQDDYHRLAHHTIYAIEMQIHTVFSIQTTNGGVLLMLIWVVVAHKILDKSILLIS